MPTRRGEQIGLGTVGVECAVSEADTRAAIISLGVKPNREARGKSLLKQLPMPLVGNAYATDTLNAIPPSSGTWISLNARHEIFSYELFV